jgi:hypothetical protein
MRATPGDFAVAAGTSTGPSSSPSSAGRGHWSSTPSWPPPPASCCGRPPATSPAASSADKPDVTRNQASGKKNRPIESMRSIASPIPSAGGYLPHRSCPAASAISLSVTGRQSTLTHAIPGQSDIPAIYRIVPVITPEVVATFCKASNLSICGEAGCQSSDSIPKICVRPGSFLL